MVGPAIVGVVRFRISNLCLSLLCLLPSTIAIVSSFCIKREGMKQGVTENGEACAESGKYEVAVSDQDDENDDGNGKGDGPVEKTTRSSPLISNFLRSLFILFYFVYVGLETGFGGETCIVSYYHYFCPTLFHIYIYPHHVALYCRVDICL